MCERAGIEIVWVADPVAGTALLGDVDAWSVAAGLLGALSKAAVGAMIDNRRGPADLVELVRARMKHDPPVGTSLEVDLVDGDGEAQGIRAVRDGLAVFGVKGKSVV